MVEDLTPGEEWERLWGKGGRTEVLVLPEASSRATQGQDWT